MSQAESSSDSDSNTSSSWIFLDDCTSSNEPEKNKYYLNCSSEPIQELTPQCLNSVNLEQETDSDGISIISESEDTKEHILTEEAPLIEDIKHIPVENLIKQVEPTEIKVEYYISKYVVIGWIIIAVMTPLLLNYFATYMRPVLDNFQGDATVQLLNSDVLENDKNVIKLNDDEISYESDMKIASILISQMNDNKNLLENKKGKVDSKGEVDIHRINYQDHQCESQSDMSKNKQKESLKCNKRNKKNHFKNDKHGLRKEVSVKKDSVDLKEVPTDEIPEEITSYEKEGINIERALENNNLRSQEHDEMVIKKKKRHKNKEFDSKPHNSPKKKNKLEKDEQQHKNKKKNKTSKEQVDNIPNRDDFYKKEIKKLKKTLEYKDKEIKKLTKIVKIKDKHLKILEHKILKELNVLRKMGKQDILTPKKYHSPQGKMNITSGEWYYKLHEGRSKFRNHQYPSYPSDWMFDQVDFRNKKRTLKSNWYWNWMNNREHLRLRRGFTY